MVDDNSGRILLVEDHADTARAFAALLDRDGYRVTTAATLAEALDSCAKQQFDLLVCDIELPDGDGIEALAVARQHISDIPGIIVSGHGDPARRDAARQAGFSDYLLKPLVYDILHASIARAIPKVTR